MPHIWRYQELRSELLESAALISAEEAERRVLYLGNPGLGGQAAVTDALFAGLQLIMRGEVAPAHRHTPSALRFIVEGSSAYTALNSVFKLIVYKSTIAKLTGLYQRNTQYSTAT